MVPPAVPGSASVVTVRRATARARVPRRGVVAARAVPVPVARVLVRPVRQVRVPVPVRAVPAPAVRVPTR